MCTARYGGAIAVGKPTMAGYSTMLEKSNRNGTMTMGLDGQNEILTPLECLLDPFQWPFQEHFKLFSGGCEHDVTNVFKE
jgi:hypothetical protein